MVSDNKIVVSIILVILVGGMAVFFLTSSSPTAKVTEQPTKEAQDISNFPLKTLGNYYKYTNAPSGTDGKVRVLFIGAEFCPFCAAERWPIAEALRGFGTFSGLKETTSASFNEPFLDLPTYNFMGATYNSNYIEFNHKETADRNFRSLETLTEEEQTLFNSYNPRGSIPFLFIGGQKGIFVQVGAGYSPGAIQGLTFSQIKSDLTNPNAKTTQSIMKEASIITALVCYNNNNKPPEVCNNQEIANLIAQLR